MSEISTIAKAAPGEESGSKEELKWSADDLIDLIRAVKFSNKDASMRMVHTEITTKMAANDSFQYLSQVKLNDVKKVWKKALTGPTPKHEEKERKNRNASGDVDDVKAALAGSSEPVIQSGSGGMLQFYTIGDGSVQSLAKDYTMKAAAEVAAEKSKEEEDKEGELRKYVHCFLDIPMDQSGTRPHQALVNFNKKKGSGGEKKKPSGKGKKKGKIKAVAADDNDECVDGDEREIVKIQMAAPVPGEENKKFPMLLYNSSRTAQTFIHPGEDDEHNYDKIRDLLISEGAKGVLSQGGTKAYFYCHITRRKGGKDIVSIDVTSGLAPAQTW